MSIRRFASTNGLLLALMLVASAPAFSEPADGNGNKFIGEFSFFQEPLDCGPDTDPLVFDAIGWFQGRFFLQEGNRNFVLTVFHLEVIYQNLVTGETWVWRDRGPERSYYLTNKDGVTELHFDTNGRAGFWNIIGHGVFNTVTGEFVFEGGQNPFGGEAGSINANDFACGVLNNGQ